MDLVNASIERRRRERENKASASNMFCIYKLLVSIYVSVFMLAIC